MSQLQSLRQRWQQLAVRERNGLALAAALVLVLIFWKVLVAPAVHTLRTVEAQSQAVELELEKMQRLQQRARTLQGQPALSASVVEKMLQAYADKLGKDAELKVRGDQATLTLHNVAATTLAQWLSDDRAAPLRFSELHLERDGGGADVRWSGDVVFQLPAASR